MAEGFGPGFDAPVIVAATLPSPHADTAVLAAAVRATPGVAYVTPVVVSKDGEAAMMIAYPATGEQNPATDVVVNRMHDTVLPRATAGTGIRAYVTGPNAGNVAFANLVGQKLPWLIGVVVALSILLLVVFRSVVIAVKAVLMNLLSITAAYGVSRNRCPVSLLMRHGAELTLVPQIGETFRPVPLSRWFEASSWIPALS